MNWTEASCISGRLLPTELSGSSRMPRPKADMVYNIPVVYEVWHIGYQVFSSLIPLMKVESFLQGWWIHLEDHLIVLLMARKPSSWFLLIWGEHMFLLDLGENICYLCVFIIERERKRGRKRRERLLMDTLTLPVLILYLVDCVPRTSSSLGLSPFGPFPGIHALAQLDSFNQLDLVI